jgi:hypothetical protein
MRYMVLMFVICRGGYGGGERMVYLESLREEIRLEHAVWRNDNERIHPPDVYFAGYFMTADRMAASDMTAAYKDTGLNVIILRVPEKTLIQQMGTGAYIRSL